MNSRAVFARLCVFAFTASTCLSGFARADVLTVVNALRTTGCGRAAAQGSLSADRRLQQAAQSWSRGMSSHAAANAAGYRATALASIHVSGFDTDAEFKDILGRRYCKTLLQSEFRNIGAAQRRGETWILLGASLKTPTNALDASRRILELANEARSRARRCGGQAFAATTSLRLEPMLEKAAAAHSREMAKYSYLEHAGRNGSTPAQRVAEAGYRWTHAGENIAAGPGTPEEAMAGWLNSPGHCANIMNPQFTELGVAYALSKDDYGIYWTQVFATPQ